MDDVSGATADFIKTVTSRNKKQRPVYKTNMVTLPSSLLWLRICGNAGRQRGDVDVLSRRLSACSQTGNYTVITVVYMITRK